MLNPQRGSSSSLETQIPPSPPCLRWSGHPGRWSVPRGPDPYPIAGDRVAAGGDGLGLRQGYPEDQSAHTHGTDEHHPGTKTSEGTAGAELIKELPALHLWLCPGLWSARGEKDRDNACGIELALTGKKNQMGVLTAGKYDQRCR